MPTVSFAFPVLPGKTSLVRDMPRVCRERHDEFVASRRRMGMTREESWIQHTPQGDLVIVHFEADDPARVFREMARSQAPFDVWFREYVKDVHGVDLTAPAPPPPQPNLVWRADSRSTIDVREDQPRPSPAPRRV